MPCRDWDDDNRLRAGADLATCRIELENLKKIFSEAPKPSLLCEACNLLEDAGWLDKASQELQNWYANHESKELDKVKLEAAEKLTVRERRLLCIDLEALRAKVKK